MNAKLTPYLLVLPVTLFLILTLGFGIGNGFLQSLGFIPSIGLNNLTFDYYLTAFKDPSFLSSLCFSLCTTLISSILSILVGVILAYSLMEKYFHMDVTKKSSILENLYTIPLLVPHIIVVVIIHNFTYQGGFLSRLSFNAGFITDSTAFPLLVNDKYGIGIILTYLWKEIPFVAIVTFSVLGNINKNLCMAAYNLGATKKKVFFHILLPLCRSSIFTSFIIIFAFSFGSYEVPFLLGPTLPNALPVKAYIEYSSPELFNRPYAMVINCILTFISFLLVFLYHKAFKAYSKNN